MFRVEFVIVLPEVARCVDTVGEMVVMNFLGQAEFTSDTVPNFGVLRPGSGRTDTFGVLVEAAFFPYKMKFLSEVRNLGSWFNLFGRDGLRHRSTQMKSINQSTETIRQYASSLSLRYTYSHWEDLLWRTKQLWLAIA